MISDFISWLLPSILSPLCYVLLVYFIAGLRDDNLAANLFTMIASVSSSAALSPVRTCHGTGLIGVDGASSVHDGRLGSLICE